MRWVIALVGFAGCYSPQPHAGAPCPDGVCPSGLTCSPATMTCELHPVDAGEHDSPDDASMTPIDAPMIDARMIDAAPPPNLPQLVQDRTTFNDSATELSLTLQTAPVAGHLLVMFGGTPAMDLAQVTGGGVTWAIASRSTVNMNEEIWYGVTDGTSSTVTIKCSGCTTSPFFMSVTEWAGLPATSPLIEGKALDGSTSPATTPAVTTTGPALLVFAASDRKPNTFGAPAPGTWTPLMVSNGTFVQQAAWYRIAPNAGTFTPAVSETAHDWDAAAAAFRYIP